MHEMFAGWADRCLLGIETNDWRRLFFFSLSPLLQGVKVETEYLLLNVM